MDLQSKYKKSHRKSTRKMLHMMRESRKYGRVLSTATKKKKIKNRLKLNRNWKSYCESILKLFHIMRHENRCTRRAVQKKIHCLINVAKSVKSYVELCNWCEQFYPTRGSRIKLRGSFNPCITLLRTKSDKTTNFHKNVNKLSIQAH